MLRRMTVTALLGLTVAAGFSVLTATAHLGPTTTAADVCNPHTTTCKPARDPWVWD